ncbi:MAG: DEAD/DEAH box helicase family protein, partial [Candidatus Eisenbacteria bacterium]|nr:DEAD/DEAH box helicase family protein [Candidatus Eisenbacteria bacterium]
MSLALLPLERVSPISPAFETSQKVVHRFNRELGPGEVLEVTATRVRVRFPRTEEVLEFSANDNALSPLVLPASADPERWWDSFGDDVLDRLARLETDSLRAWKNRIDGYRLRQIREAQGLGSFLGGRIEIFPHQLHVAEQAVATDPVRWLLADEVGLGKTIEACLILSHLVRTGRVDGVLVVAPASLTVQWLGELYRKFHQVFVLLDEERLKDVRKDFGEEFNPFHAHPRSVVALEEFVEHPELAKQAQEAGLDLLVIDEAHRLERRRGHPGTPAYRTMAPLCESVDNVLLLSATPLDADTHGFFRLLQLLRPEAYPNWDQFEDDLKNQKPLYPCTSATRRDDIGGLPPRVPYPIQLPEWSALNDLMKPHFGSPTKNALEKKRRVADVARTLETPTGIDDPRLKWIIKEFPNWKDEGEKVLIFVHSKDTLDFLKKELEKKTLKKISVFHEDLSPAARDLEVAQFATPEGPTLMVSTEAGGEGRNFEFCRGLVLFDLPFNPALVEQRIGRLDRISRTRPVEVYYFKSSEPFSAHLTELYEALGVFKEPLGGLDRSLAHVEQALEDAIASGSQELDIPRIIEETREARALMGAGILHHLHQNRYQPELEAGILERIPKNL